MFRGFLSRLAVAIVGITVGACSSIDCPINTPQCCYNVLFGCSIWDLPSGCTCADYGFGFANQSAAAKISAAPATPAKRLDGGWTGTMSKYRNSCPGAVPSVSGIVTIDAAKNSVRVNIPGYGSIRGRTIGRYHFAGSGAYVDTASGCTADVRVAGVSSRLGQSRVYTTANIKCGSAFQCSASYSGTIVRR